MRPIRSFTVVPALPPALARLRELAYNLRWAWDRPTINLFRRLDSDLWEGTGHNPVRLLGSIKQERLEEAAADDGFRAHLERVCEAFDSYMAAEHTWYGRLEARERQPPLRIAYFSMEYGLTEALPMHSGGLGVLAGDHLKSASDLHLPLIGVGLLYQEGYFRQYLNVDGWQAESYPINDFYNQPVQLEHRPDGSPVTIQVRYCDRRVTAQVWRVQVGRLPLYLLDTNLPENESEDRDVTDRLYGGDVDLRIRQEILLGIGGVRALEALGLRPTVCHMNEGHSAFLALERIRQLVSEHGLSFAEARELATASNVFSTHTPMPAGIDRFSPELIDRYFGHWYERLGVTQQEFLGLGREVPEDRNEPLNMAVLALRLSAGANGVSRLHGQVARRMWWRVWPGLPEHEVPILSVTNGVHVFTWVSEEMGQLYERYLGPRWMEDPADPVVWAAAEEIPSEELWRTHERRRERLISFARRRVRAQLEQRGAPPSEVAAASEVLDPSALTIGFARRFATYKRALLVFRDPERLARILGSANMPVQILFAGKAHPHDTEAKEYIRQLVHFLRRPEFRRHMVFLEDYDMTIARYLVQGVDLWLNTPRRPQEASGTSGMKVALNGGLNTSVLDGWWAEAYHPEVGWAIGHGEQYEDLDYQDEVESRALYDLLEKDIVPLFYDRGPDRLPRGWIAKMKRSLQQLAPFFNTHRMVREYAERLYVAGATRYQWLAADGMAGAKALAAWRATLRTGWPQVRVLRVEAEIAPELPVGQPVDVRALVQLGELRPEDVRVELYYGPLDQSGQLSEGTAVLMQPAAAQRDGRHLFTGTLTSRTSGLHGYTLRILPHHPELTYPHEAGHILWAQGKD